MSTVLGNLLFFLFVILLPLWMIFKVWRYLLKGFRKYYSPTEGEQPGTWKKAGLVVWLALQAFVIFFLLAFLAAMLGLTFFVQGPFLLVFGWVPFLIEKFPQITPNWEGLAMALTSLTLLVYGGHWFLRWLYSHWGQAQASDSQKPWPMRWTLSLVALLFLFFSASIGFIGATHQTAWMIGANESLVKSSWANRWINSDSKSNLHNIYLACKAYWQDHSPDNSCNVEIALQTTYGYIQSANVVVRAGGSEREFHAVAGHLKSDRWFWMNPLGTISELEMPEVNARQES